MAISVSVVSILAMSYPLYRTRGDYYGLAEVGVKCQKFVFTLDPLIKVNTLPSHVE